MGNRVKGRVKRKSIKAAISSTAGSKRKLSRMGKKRKKEHAGLEATFLGRSKVLKMLQISLKDFRRLCILKGIYPREPRKAPHGKAAQSYYHIKDIRSIAHEPVLDKFREFKSFLKKVKRASGRFEIDEANRRHALLPQYTVHHLVKERYPRFVDALNDIDDCLTLTYLFAALPSATLAPKHGVPSKCITKAKQLAAAWGAYCATTGSITKSFISVKGIYMEASIESSIIRWIIPHAFTQFVPAQVDFQVMSTFFELYQVLLDFVLYKLYNDHLQLRYPISNAQLMTMTNAAGTTSSLTACHLQLLMNSLQSNGTEGGGMISNVVAESVKTQEKEQQDEEGGGGGGEQEKPKKKESRKDKKKKKELIESVDDALKQLSETSDDDDDDDDDESVDIAGPLKAALEQQIATTTTINNNNKNNNDDDDDNDETTLARKRLFQGLTFFLSREIPRGYLELVCLAYGGKVGWEGGSGNDNTSPIEINDKSITHHIVDRPVLPASYDKLPKSREYIQPQWILDCANFVFLLPVAKYGVGANLPPHLSPWVDHEEEGYTPAYATEIERLKQGLPPLPEEEVVVAEEKEKEKKEVNDNDSTSTSSSSDSEEEDEDKTKEHPKEDIDMVEKDDDKKESEEEEDEPLVEEEEEEDEAVVQKRLERKRKQEEDETHKLAKSMMNRKAAALYGRMQHGIAKKQEKIDKLHQRRKQIIVETSKEEDKLEGKKKDESGKTVLKQKVERLKKERKQVENKYDNTGGTMSKKKKTKKSGR